LLSGCGAVARFDDTGSLPATVGSISGKVHGGQQPVTGSLIQLYATNMTTVKGASTALIASPVATGTGGSFNITGTYSCPSSTSLVYLVASGGNPGLATGTNNTGLSMMALLGACGNLSGSTQVIINELTTVAAVESLIPYMSDGLHVGANLTTTPNALSLAFTASDTLVDVSTGAFRAVASGAPTPYYALYNTLADILAACINTNGAGVNGSSYDTSKPCGQLFFAAGTGLAPYGLSTYAPDTLAAMLRMATFPSTNVGSLFTLVGGTGAPFQPTITPQPNDFTPQLSVTVPFAGNSSFNYPRLVAIDAQQNIWVAQWASSYIYVYDQSMKLLRTIVSDTYSIVDLQADPSGNIWAYGSGYLSKYAPDGTQLSPAGSWNGFYSAGFRMTGTAMTIDVNGNVWLTALQSAGTQGSACFVKVSPTGVILSTAPGTCVSAGPAQYPLSLTSDPSGNVYMSTQNPLSIVKVNNSGTLLNGPTGTVTAYRGLSIKYHAPSDQILALDQPSIYAFKASDSTYASYYIGSGHNLENTSSFTLDGAGNLWFGNTPNIGNSGTVTSAAAELTVPFSVTAWRSLALRHPIPGDVGLNDPEGVGVDAYGNLWLVSYGNRTLTKIASIAVPRTTQVP
jgi:streptogramin lyase